MRNSYWLVTFLLVLECVVLLIEPAECFLNFIPVSVHTALQILTLLVKIKSIIFKILLGLKLMGVEGFIMRRRRRSLSDDYNDISWYHPTDQSYLDWKLRELPVRQRTELLLAWKRLERLLGQRIHFQEGACVEAVHKIWRPITIWDGDEVERTVFYGGTADQSGRVQSSSSASYWISTVLGSAFGRSPYACHILEKQLNYSRPKDIPTTNSISSFFTSFTRAKNSALSSSSLFLAQSNSVQTETGAFS